MTKWHILLAINIPRKNSTPHIHILDSIYNINRKLMLYVMVAYYTDKYITFNKGQSIGHMEPPMGNMSQTSVNSVMIQKNDE